MTPASAFRTWRRLQLLQEPVLAAGADTVAVIGAVCRGHIGRNCERLLAAVEEVG